MAKQVKNKIKAQKAREAKGDTLDDGVEASKNLYPAIELLRDPQGLAEVVLKRVQSTGANGFRFEHKILAMNFVTRLVGNHELMLLGLYPFLRRYMGGHQKDVTKVLAYSVQACHELVPPEEVHGLLQTIAHNFITERCTGEQMAVGINACRAICIRVPSSLVKEDANTLNEEMTGTTSSVHIDVEAFAKDLSGYAKHRDRSVAVAGRSWQNFIREVYPSLLQGKHRGRTGAALHKAGTKPKSYGEHRAADGVAGADLLIEYEAKKEEYLKKQAERKANGESSDDDESDDGIADEPMNDVSDDEAAGMDDDEVAPKLIKVKEIDGKMVPEEDIDSEGKETSIDLSKMTAEERAKLKQDVSSTRIFTAADFAKMRKLVEREERIKRDPRAAARLKRRRAQGKEFEELSDDDGYSSDEDDGIHVKGAVNFMDIAAEAKKKRANKIERLTKIVEGRDKFEHKQREGGSTNTEKTRKKNFLMTKNSFANRTKQGNKQTARDAARGHLKKTKQHSSGKQDSGKRRRKF